MRRIWCSGLGVGVQVSGLGFRVGSIQRLLTHVVEVFTSTPWPTTSVAECQGSQQTSPPSHQQDLSIREAPPRAPRSGCRIIGSPNPKPETLNPALNRRPSTRP